MTSAAAIRERFDAAPMSATQTVVIGLTFALSAIDGYDVLSIAFAAPAITQGWHIDKTALGIVLSAGLFGMAIGAFVLAPLADVVGRKTIVIVSLGLMAAGMFMCGFAGTKEALALWRVVTGLGIGGCVATINPIAAEFANTKRRSLTVSIMAIGYPVGGVVGGLLAAALLRRFEWHAVFLAGFVAAMVLLPLVIWLMPESPAYLLTQRGSQALPRLNHVLGRCGHQPVAALPDGRVVDGRSYFALFAPRQIGATSWITIANLLFAAAAYYVLSWLPQMVSDAGFPPSSGSLISAIASLAGVVGGLTLGWLAQRHGLRHLTAGTMVGMGLTTIAFGLTPPSLPLLMVAGGVCGLFLFSGASGLYATIATTFSDEARASASGFVSGVGRVSSALAPLAAGFLFTSGLSRGQVSAVFGAAAIAAGLIILTGWTRFRTA